MFELLIGFAFLIIPPVLTVFVLHWLGRHGFDLRRLSERSSNGADDTSFGYGDDGGGGGHDCDAGSGDGGGDCD